MGSGDSLQEFLEVAKKQGTTDETVVSLLRGRGWPEEAIYRALAEDYERRSGTRIPQHKPSGSAKDAFLYLLSFSTLAVWTIGLGSIVFSLIDRWIKDPLSQPTFYGNTYDTIANSLACVIVAFPVYLFCTRYVLRDTQRHPEKLESAVRKWLTYVALFIAAVIVVCDLIAFLTYFLQGELSARFAAKVADVLVIAGGVFWYYLGAMRGHPSMANDADD